MGAERNNHVKDLGGNVTALNEALMLGLVRQHELTEAAELLKVQLQAEMLGRQKAEGALREHQTPFKAIYDATDATLTTESPTLVSGYGKGHPLRQRRKEWQEAQQSSGQDLQVLSHEDCSLSGKGRSGFTHWPLRASIASFIAALPAGVLLTGRKRPGIQAAPMSGPKERFLCSMSGRY